jgi:PAS domain S-box-containing protein
MLASQIGMKIQFISDDRKRLRDISQTRILAAQERTGTTIVVLIVTLAVANGTIYLLSVRTIVRSQRALLENQQRLRESREDLNRAQAVAHVGSWRLNLQSNELTWSDESYRIAGIPKGTPLTYESFMAIVHPEDREYVDRKWKAALHGEPYDIEFRIVVNGEIRSARGQARLEFDAHGQLLNGFGAFHDITERKRAEETLRENQHRLELALEAAQAADRAKDRFLATLSHELRTPLTPVLMTVATLLRAESLDADTRRRLEVIRRNVEAQAQMINDLLDLSQIIHDKLHLRPGDVDAHQILQRTLKICTADGDNGKLQVTVDLDAQRHHVRGDEARLQQVFWNLIQNAFKFTPAGGKLSIRSSNDGGRLRLTVSDTGRGIEAPLLERIFEPFEQGDRKGGASVQGLGLGLADLQAD